MQHSCSATLLKCVVFRLNGFIVGVEGWWVLQPLAMAATKCFVGFISWAAAGRCRTELNSAI